METAISVFNQIAVRIIAEQGNIIGDLAWNEAAKIEGIEIVGSPRSVNITGDPKSTIDKLISRYEKLFGKLSREICKSSVSDLISEIPPTDLPDSLK